MFGRCIKLVNVRFFFNGFDLFKITFFLNIILLQTIVYGQFQKIDSENNNTVKLVFHTVVGLLPLQLDSIYINSQKDTFSVSKFKYFISHISFVDDNGKEEKIQEISKRKAAKKIAY